MLKNDFIKYLSDRPEEKYYAFIIREKNPVVEEIIERIPIELSIDDVKVEGSNTVSVARFTYNPSIVTFKEDATIITIENDVSPIPSDDDESSDDDHSIFKSTDDDEEYLLKRRKDLTFNDYEVESDESDEYGTSDYDRFNSEFNQEDNKYVVFSEDENSMYIIDE